jgi:lysophospholipase L1-like esterase
MKLLTFALALGLPCLLQAQPAAPAVENTAIIPTGKLENDFYDWNKRHAEILAIKDGINPEIVLIGDSITHLWGGLPEEPKGNRGAASWKELFGDKRVLNCGFGWDRTQNVLFRIANGELDGLKPRTVVIHIGTNNLAGTKNARKNSPEEIASAITLIAGKVHEKCPAAKVILMAVFPRGEKPDNPHRDEISKINEALVKGGIRDLPWLTYLDITNEFLNADGTISREVMGDFLHPAEKGYAVWASALKPHVR